MNLNDLVSHRDDACTNFQDTEASRDREWDSGDDSPLRRNRGKRHFSDGGNKTSDMPRRSMRVLGKEQQHPEGASVPAEEQQEVRGLRREALVLGRKVRHHAYVFEAEEQELSSSKRLHALTPGSKEQKAERLERELELLKGKTAQMKFKNEGFRNRVVRAEKQYAESLLSERQKVVRLQGEVEQYKGIAGRLEVDNLGLKDQVTHCVSSLAHQTQHVVQLEKRIGQLQQEAVEKTSEIERLRHTGAYSEKKLTASLSEKRKVKRLVQKVEMLEEEVRTTLQEAEEARTRARKSELELKEYKDRAESEGNDTSTWERRADRSQHELAVAVADGARIRMLEEQHAAALSEECNKRALLKEQHASALSKERREKEQLERRLAAALESGPEEIVRLRRKLGRSRRLCSELAVTVEEAKRLSDEQSKFLAKRIADMKRTKLEKKDQAILWRETSDSMDEGDVDGESSGGRLAVAPQVTVTIDEDYSFSTS